MPFSLNLPASAIEIRVLFKTPHKLTLILPTTSYFIVLLNNAIRFI